MDSLKSRYGITVKQVKVRLLRLRWDPKRSLFGLSIEVGQLVELAHPYVPVSERG